MIKPENLNKELLIKLTLSGLPPSLQEYVINNLDKLTDESKQKIILILDKISINETVTTEVTKNFSEFLQNLQDKIGDKQKEEIKKIKQELLTELND